jgi:serine/threonine protein kinase
MSTFAALIPPPNAPQSSTSHKISSGSYGSVSFDSYNPRIAIKKSSKNVFSASVCETSILSFLNHPNIIKPLSINYSGDGSCEIFMERYLGNLANDEWLNHTEKIKKSPSTILIRLLGEIASAMNYMHGCGIIHADLKTQNILFDVVKVDVADTKLTNKWKIKPIICDFGISIIHNSEYSNTNLQTLNYRAPEVDHKYYNSGDIWECAISDKIDVWSFGCIAFELFTGHKFLSSKSSKFPSWLICAEKFGLESISKVDPDDNVRKNSKLEKSAKSQLFSLDKKKICEVITQSMENSEWKRRMKVANKIFISSLSKNCDVSGAMFGLFEEIITGCLQPNPNNRWGSEKVFKFFKVDCGDIIDLSLSPEISIPVMHMMPKFKIPLFESTVEEGLDSITDVMDSVESQKRVGVHIKVRNFMGEFEHAGLLSKLIELKYYEKKTSRRILGTDRAMQIMLSSCMIAGIMLHIDDLCSAIEKFCSGESLIYEISSELCGNFL